MIQPNTLASKLSTAGKYSIIGCCFFIPLSTSVMGAFGALVILFWLISGKIARLPLVIRKSPLAAISSLLIVLFVIGMFYSPAPWEEILDVFKKYRELFFIPAIMCLVLDDESGIIKKAVTAYFIGGIILLGTSYLMAFGIIPPDHYGNSLIQHIAHSFFMAILAFWTMHKTYDSEGKYKVLWLLLLAAVIGNIVYIAPGRTGMLTFFLLCILFIWQRFSWKKQVIAYVLFGLLVSIAFISSRNLQTRFYDALHDVQSYKQGISRSSQGMRLDWWYDSGRLILEKPLLGHGTGSFTMEHDRLIQGTDIEPTDNPHNEYLLIAVQLGTAGLLAFLGLFVAGWLDALKQEPDRKRLAQGVIISMMVGCLMNSFLFDSHQGHYFAFLTALLCAPVAVRNAGDSAKNI